MYYFRPLPDLKVIFSLFKFLFRRPVLRDNEALYFPRSRDGMNFVLKTLSQSRNRKLSVGLPSLFCWEILHEFDASCCNLSFYEITENYQPVWEELEKQSDSTTLDVLFLVSFFGISTDIEKARNFCQKNNVSLFLDNTHCLIPEQYPEKNEFLFLSSYKQIPISIGSILYINKHENENLLGAFDTLQLRSDRLTDLIWWLKSCYVLLTRRMKYLDNNYISKDPSEKALPISIERDIDKGISAFTHDVLRSSYSEAQRLVSSLKKNYDFYDRIVMNINKYIPCTSLNTQYANSHLYGIQFTCKKDAVEGIRLLRKLKLPVVIWPEKKYIHALKSEAQIEKVKHLIDCTAFLCAFSSNLSTDNKEQEKICNIELWN